MIDETVFRDGRLCVVGNICRDVKIAPINADDRLFHDGETPTRFIVETIGGGGANSALSAAGLGADVRFAGKLGTDALGTRLETALLSRGVKPFVRRDPETQTGSSVALSFSNGCRHFISAQPNNDTFCFEDIDLSVLDGGGHLLRADVWFSEPLLGGGNARLLQAARDRGLTTSLDLNWDPHWGSASEDVIQRRKEAVRQILPLVDLVHGNVRELNIFADKSDIAATLKQLADWVRQGRGASHGRRRCRLLLPRRLDGRAQCAGAAVRQYDGHRGLAQRLHDAAQRPERYSRRRQTPPGQSHRGRFHRGPPRPAAAVMKEKRPNTVES